MQTKMGEKGRNFCEDLAGYTDPTQRAAMGKSLKTAPGAVVATLLPLPQAVCGARVLSVTSPVPRAAPSPCPHPLLNHDLCNLTVSQDRGCSVSQEAAGLFLPASAHSAAPCSTKDLSGGGEQLQPLSDRSWEDESNMGELWMAAEWVTRPT